MMYLDKISDNGLLHYLDPIMASIVSVVLVAIAIPALVANLLLLISIRKLKHYHHSSCLPFFVSFVLSSLLNILAFNNVNVWKIARRGHVTSTILQLCDVTGTIGFGTTCFSLCGIICDRFAMLIGSQPSCRDRSSFRFSVAASVFIWTVVVLIATVHLFTPLRLDNYLIVLCYVVNWLVFPVFYLVYRMKCRRETINIVLRQAQVPVGRTQHNKRMLATLLLLMVQPTLLGLPYLSVFVAENVYLSNAGSNLRGLRALSAAKAVSLILMFLVVLISPCTYMYRDVRMMVYLRRLKSTTAENFRFSWSRMLDRIRGQQTYSDKRVTCPTTPTK